MKIAVLISGNGTNMQAIAQAINNGKIDANIVAVISDKPNCLGIQTAQSLGFKTLVINESDYSERSNFDLALASELEKLAPDLIVLAGFMRILTGPFVNQFSNQILNIHPSLLPKYKGLNTHERMLTSDDAKHGVSVHFVTPELDGGPILAQAKITVVRDSEQSLELQTETLKMRIQKMEYQLYPLCLYWVISEQLSFCSGELRFNGQAMPSESGIQLTEQQLAQAWSEL